LTTSATTEIILELEGFPLRTTLAKTGSKMKLSNNSRGRISKIQRRHLCQVSMREVLRLEESFWLSPTAGFSASFSSSTFTQLTLETSEILDKEEFDL